MFDYPVENIWINFSDMDNIYHDCSNNPINPGEIVQIKLSKDELTPESWKENQRGIEIEIDFEGNLYYVNYTPYIIKNVDNSVINGVNCGWYYLNFNC